MASSPTSSVVLGDDKLLPSTCRDAEVKTKTYSRRSLQVIETILLNTDLFPFLSNFTNKFSLESVNAFPKFSQQSCLRHKFVDRLSTSLSLTLSFTPRSDQHINSPHKFNKLSSKKVMRIKKIIIEGIVF